MFSGLTPVHLGLLGAIAAAAFTGLGAALDRFIPALPLRPAIPILASLLLAVSAFSLGLPAGELLASSHYSDLALVSLLMAGMILGGLGFDAMRSASSCVGAKSVLVSHALHNLPEGLAVGTALASPWPIAGLPLLLGVALHNLLDGIAVARSVRGLGWSTRRTVAAAFLTAAVEPMAAIAGVALVTIWHPLLPWVLLGTAGGMMEMVRTEVLPQSRRRHT